MTLIFCKICGKAISENADVCPSCGEPQKAGNNSFLLVLITGVLLGIGGVIGYSVYSSSGNPATELERKKEIVTEILGKDCTFITQASSEYINKPMIAAVVAAAVSNRCGCVQEVIVPKMLDAYSLKELQALKAQPIHALQEVGNIVIENIEEIQKHCLYSN